MTLEEKILSITSPSLESTMGLLPTDKKCTMHNLFKDFIKLRLPDKNVVKAWHKLLMEYTDETNLSSLSCCVRYGNNGSSKISDYGESNYEKLRRGWLTKNTTDDFEYFFADNAASAYIYKMVWDGFVPSSVDELRDIFKSRKFPCCFDFLCDKSVHEYKGVIVDRGMEDPGFLGNYKISHVLDAGENFLLEDGSVLGDTDLSPKYYPIGHSNDFLSESDKIRKMVISPESKKIIVAKFLRFIHPLNFFLTPSSKLHTCSTKVHRNDIGEDPVMIYLVKQYLKKEYKKEYKEFLERALWIDEYIGITYGPKKSKSKKKIASSPTGTKVSSKKPTLKTTSSKGKSLSLLESKYTHDKLIEIAAYYLRNYDGLKKIEQTFRLKENKGFEAQSILNALGIDTSGKLKGILSSTNIDDAITTATGLLKKTLEEIKRRGL